MAYADYGFYLDFYVGSVISDEKTFRALAERASEYISSVTFDRINDEIRADKALMDKIKRCCCALAENICKYDNSTSKSNTSEIAGAKTSEKIGQYSVNYANPIDSIAILCGGTFADYQKHTALKYLGSTGLMYRGV